jgi:hypothetical protein
LLVLPLLGPLRSASAADEPNAQLNSDELSPLEPPVVDVPQSPRRTRWYGLAGLGLAYRWAFDKSMVGGVLDGELGAQNLRLAGGVRLHIEAGRMLGALPYQVVTFGPTLWTQVYDRLRIGVGVDAGALLLSRRTRPGSSMWTVLIGGHLSGSVDLVRLGVSSALQAEATVGAYALTSAPGPLSMLSTLGLSYRP